jgi:tRNA A37 threonylcarbamoyladenosine synthetase subunit TsaC/SUA5/YrdC
LLFENSLILTQTDTTVGFLSKNPNLINIKKNRQGKKGLIKVVSSFKELNNEVRVPQKFRKYVRHSKQTTFIYTKKNKAIRVVSEGIHHNFLKRFKSFYSSSANISGS